MPSKKSVSGQRGAAKRVSVAALANAPARWTPGGSVRGLKQIRVWGDTGSMVYPKGRRIKKLPNPFPPEDIVALVKIVLSTAGLASVAYKTVKLWFDSQNAKSIRIKKGDVEIELHGRMSATEIERVAGHFRRLTKNTDEEQIKVILPPSADRAVPSPRVNQKGGGKK
jgi:hypothetical protein